MITTLAQLIAYIQANIFTNNQGKIAAASLAAVLIAIVTYFGSSTPPGSFNPVDYGAICDGKSHPLSVKFSTLPAAQAVYASATALTDETDGRAIDAAYAAARAFVPAQGQIPAVIAFPNKGTCLANTSINATLLRSDGMTTDGRGAIIYTTATGLIAFDTTGTQRHRFKNLTIIANNGASAPKVGFYAGRYAANVTASANTYEDVTVSGIYATAAFVNGGTEASTWIRPIFSNSNTTNCDMSSQALMKSCAYAEIVDGAYLFGITSQYVTITLTPDTYVSTAGDVTVGGQFLTANSGSPPLWISGAWQHIYSDTYIANTVASGAGRYGVVLWSGTGISEQEMHFDTHIESNILTNNFYVTGEDPTPLFNGFDYADYTMFGGTSVFATDPALTLVTMQDGNIRLSQARVIGATLWDNPAKWSFEGRIHQPTKMPWTNPASIQGVVCIDQGCANLVPTESITINPDFLLDQPFEGTVSSGIANGGVITDGWHVKSNGSGGSHITHQRITTFQYLTYNNAFTSTVASTLTPAATDRYAMRTVLEGPDLSDLRYGQPAAISLVLDFCAKDSLAGTYSFFLQNPNATRSYAQNFTLAAANTPQCFSFTIPGDTTGTWFNGVSQTGAFLGFSFLTGSSFVAPTPAAWQAGDYTAASGATAFSTNAGATLNITGVHVYRGQFNVPYRQRSPSDELLKAQRFFEKSFIVAVAPAQNAGVVGAASITTPYTTATAATVSTNVYFQTEMWANSRTTPPTITLFSTGAATSNCYSLTRSADSGAASATNVGTKNFTLTCTLVGGDTAGSVLGAQWSASAAW